MVIIMAFQFDRELLLSLERIPHPAIRGQYQGQIKGSGVHSVKVTVKKKIHHTTVVFLPVTPVPHVTFLHFHGESRNNG